jgi:hypothetical protein
MEKYQNRIEDIKKLEVKLAAELGDQQSSELLETWRHDLKLALFREI